MLLATTHSGKNPNTKIIELPPLHDDKDFLLSVILSKGRRKGALREHMLPQGIAA